jgi:primosomal protein N' (replication factor Y) (superfamily II helicase)
VILSVGQRVQVPLGRGNKPTGGIVVAVGGRELLGDVAAAKVKPILRATPGRLPDQLVELARWMAEYYVCPLGMVLATMLPAAVKHGTGLRSKTEVEMAPGEDALVLLESDRLKPAARKAWESISALDEPGPWDPRLLSAKIGAANLAPINRLLELGLLRKVEREEVRTRTPVWEQYRLGDAGRAPAVELTDEQRRIAEGVCKTLGGFRVHLLRGVTGSGKTEVYMRIIHEVLGRGDAALVLVPEISLTPQTAGRFIDRFRAHGAVAVLHSGLSAAERHKQWAIAASGKAAVVVGARSAVFAPLPKLGMIVVDEEHATDYKQDQLPRYNGRDVAIKRAQLQGCPVLLGSATPSLESWANATVPPVRYRLWELTERVGGGRMPQVEVVDLREERRALARSAPRADARAGEPTHPRQFQAIGPRMEAAIWSTLHAGGQAILLLNRRGYSSYIACPSATCGWVMECDDCDASMVLHRHDATPAGQLLRCHHCLAEQVVPVRCPLCGRAPIAMGVGTQKLEDELSRKFPALRPGETMVRVDGDTMRTAKDYFEVLARFGRGEIRLLLGTQMIAKGLDFPNVRLVGVINADMGLALPDFRSAERTFQLVCQVAGRAGRGEHAGRVVVQTCNPDAPCIQRAAAHDYVGFAQEELAVRKRSGLPPWKRMARVVVRDESFDKARAQAEGLARLLRDAGGPRMTLLGPGPCPISRIAGQFRFGMELLAPAAAELQGALASVRAAGMLKSDAHTAVDVDPVALM